MNDMNTEFSPRNGLRYINELNSIFSQNRSKVLCVIKGDYTYIGIPINVKDDAVKCKFSVQDLLKSVDLIGGIKSHYVQIYFFIDRFIMNEIQFSSMFCVYGGFWKISQLIVNFTLRLKKKIKKDVIDEWVPVALNLVFTPLSMWRRFDKFYDCIDVKSAIRLYFRLMDSGVDWEHVAAQKDYIIEGDIALDVVGESRMSKYYYEIICSGFYWNYKEELSEYVGILDFTKLILDRMVCEGKFHIKISNSSQMLTGKARSELLALNQEYKEFNGWIKSDWVKFMELGMKKMGIRFSTNAVRDDWFRRSSKLKQPRKIKYVL